MTQGSAVASWSDVVITAHGRIAPHIRRTPLIRSDWLSDELEADVFLKLESLQRTGSFKLRGALNKLLSLSADERSRGVVTASTGNHGAAVALAQSVAAVSGTIFVPETAEPSKIARIRALGGTVAFFGRDSVETEIHAREVADREGRTFVSPYNDLQIAAGQGTVGFEMAADLDRIDTAFVSVGGGGLISGIAGYLDAVSPGTTIVGCSPQNSAVMAASIERGGREIVELESLPTLSDGTAGGIEAGAVTLAWCRDLVDEFVLVDESEIEWAMRQLLFEEHLLIEGAAGVAVAAALRQRDRLGGRQIVIVICGGNVGKEIVARLSS